MCAAARNGVLQPRGARPNLITQSPY